MKRSGIFLLLFALAVSLRGQGLDSARLFDWFYPSEAAYQSLSEAIKVVPRQGWVVSLIQKGEPIPQASARELALDLRFDPKTPQELKARLKKQFAPESSQITTAGDGSEGRDLTGLEARFAVLNKRMDELEKTVKMNHYDRRTFPTTSFSVRAAGANSGGGGLLEGSNIGYFTGGIYVNFDGAGDAGGFNFRIGQVIDRQSWYPIPPQSMQSGILGTSGANFQMGYKDATVAVNLGGGHTLDRSVLVMASAAAPGAPNNFVVDMEAEYGNRPTYNTPELKLGFPKGGTWQPTLIYVNKQGTSTYWPFVTSEVYFGPEQGFMKTYSAKKYVWGAYVQGETGNLYNLVDHNLLYATVTGAYNDKDQLRSFGVGDSPAGGMAWSLGSDTLLPWGGELFVEYGQSGKYSTETGYSFSTPSRQAQIEGYPASGVTITGFERRFFDQAVALAYTHPIGIATVGLLYSHIGPYFVPDQGAVNSLLVVGTASDPAVSPYNAGIITPWYNAPSPGGHMEDGKVIVDKTRDISWGTNASDAAGLMTNTDSAVLQAQFSWSWLSMSYFGGTSSQIEASGPWIKTQPKFESGNGGAFLLYNRFGGSYWLPPFPGTPAPPKVDPVLGGPNFSYYQWAFNSPADGQGIDDQGGVHDVHWNALAQFSFQRLDYYVILSEKGVGDKHFDGFSLKYVNYGAASLKFDFQSLLGRLTPFELQVFGMTSDVAPGPAVPRFGDAGKPGSADMPYFSSAYVSAFARYGVTPVFTLVGIGGHEEWKSNHSYYPIFTGLSEYGLGFDVDMNKVLTGLSIFSRARILYFEDYNIAQRQFNVWETSLGTSLNF